MFSLPMGEAMRLYVRNRHTEKNGDLSTACRQTLRAYAFSSPESRCSRRMDATLPLLVPAWPCRGVVDTGRMCRHTVYT